MAPSNFSLALRPGLRSQLDYAIKTRTGLTTSAAVRFFVAIDPDAEFGPSSGYAIFDLGSATQRAVEIALVNPNQSEPGLPALQLRLITASSEQLLYTSKQLPPGAPVYVELLFRRAATTDLVLRVGTPEPDFNLSSFAVSAADLNRTRFGILRYLGENSPSHGTAYISSIAGLDNPVNGTVIGTRSTLLAEDLANERDGSHSIAVGDRVWYTGASPPRLYGVSTINPHHNPFYAEFTNTHTVAYQAPVHVDGRIIFKTLLSGNTYYHVVDASTGTPVGTIVYEGDTVTSDLYEMIPGKDCFYDVASVPNPVTGTLYRNGILCFDPFLLTLRWSSTPYTHFGDALTFGDVALTSFLPLNDQSDGEFLISRKVGSETQHRIAVLDEGAGHVRGDPVPDILDTLNTNLSLGIPMVIQPGGQWFGLSAVTGGYTSPDDVWWGYVGEPGKGPDNRIWPSQGGQFPVYQIPAPEYGLHYWTNPTLGVSTNSERRSLMAISSTTPKVLFFATASPAYATNSNVQSIKLYAVNLPVEGGASYGTLKWSVSLCSNLSGNVALGCRLGSIQCDEAGFVYATFEYPDASSTMRTSMSVHRFTDGTTAVPYFTVYAPGYPMPSSVQGGKLRYVVPGTSPYGAERWLDAGGTRAYGDLDLFAASDFTPDLPAVTTRLEKIPLPLVPSVISAGGILEVYEKRDGVLNRLAFVNDVQSGLRLTRSLLGLDKLEFTIANDRFSIPPGQDPGFLSDLQEQWQASHDSEDTVPYDKASAVAGHVYLMYTEEDGRHRLFRVTTIDEEESSSLAGVAVDAAVELSDFLTQYSAGRSQFAGLPPSEVATHILEGKQSFRITNRRFTRDEPIRADIADKIPNMTPATISAVAYGALPYVVELSTIEPDSASLFSGNPYLTVPPRGTKRALETGFYGYHGWNDGSATQGHFVTLVTDGGSDQKVAGPINFDQASAFQTGENFSNVSRVIYGAIRADQTGLYTLRLSSGKGQRAYFRGQQVTNSFSQTLYVSLSWTSHLTAGYWYPFVFHNTNDSLTTQRMRFYWTPPSGTEVIVPATNLSHQMHGGLFCVRAVDVDGVIRFLMCYKRWDGKAIVIGFPLPYSFVPPSVTSPSHWPKTLPPGTTIDEVSFPKDSPLSSLVDWGSGWTRSPGPRLVNSRPSFTSQFSSDIKDI